MRAGVRSVRSDAEAQGPARALRAADSSKYGLAG